MNRIAAILAIGIAFSAAPTRSVAQETPADTMAAPEERVMMAEPVAVPVRVSPGGVRIHSRRNNRPRIIIRTPQPQPQPVPIAGSTIPIPASEGLSQADLDRLVAAMVDAIQRIVITPQTTTVMGAAPPPIIVQTPEPRVIRDTVYVYVETPGDTVEVSTPNRGVRVPIRPPVDTVEEIERAFMDTGLFRTILVNFEFDRSELLSSSFPTLDAVAEVMTSYPAIRVQVLGHTDSIGSDDYNARLSDRRAQSVADYLRSRGISSDRLESVGLGEQRPIAANTSPTGRTLNRRVEFMVLNPEAAVRENRKVRPE